MKKPPHIDDAGELGTEPAYMRELLDAGRNANATGYDFEAGLARHMAHVQAGTPLPDWAQSLVQPAASGAGAAAASGGGALGLKLLPWLAGSLVAAGVVTAVVLTDSSEAHAPVGQRAVQMAPAVSGIEPAPAPAAEPNVAAEPAVVVEQPELVAQPVEPAAPATDDTQRVLRAVKREHAQRGAGKAAPTASNAKLAPSSSSRGQGRVAVLSTPTNREASSTSTHSAVPSEQPQAIARTESAPTTTATEPQPAPKPVLDDTRLEREMGMLAMAQRVLASDPERALRLAKQGEHEFAGSMFTQERQQVLLLALIELGRLDEAKRLAKPYLQKFPNGPFSDRLRRALVTGKVGR